MAVYSELFATDNQFRVLDAHVASTSFITVIWEFESQLNVAHIGSRDI